MARQEELGATTHKGKKRWPMSLDSHSRQEEPSSESLGVERESTCHIADQVSVRWDSIGSQPVDVELFVALFPGVKRLADAIGFVEWRK